MHSWQRNSYNNKENICPEQNLTEYRQFCTKAKNQVSNSALNRTNKSKGNKFDVEDENKNYSVQMQEYCSGGGCCCEPYCTCATNKREATEPECVSRGDKGNEKTVYTTCVSCSPKYEPTKTSHAISTQKENLSNKHAVTLPPSAHTAQQNTPAEGICHANNRLSALEQRQRQSKRNYLEHKEHLQEKPLLREPQHRSPLSSARQPYEERHEQQKEYANKYDAAATKKKQTYRRNMSELLRLRRNQAYRRSLEHEYNVRLSTLQEELNARIHDLREENKQNTKTRFMNEIACRQRSPHGKRSSKENVSEERVSGKFTGPATVVTPMTRTTAAVAASTNLSALEKSHPYFTPPILHESSKKRHHIHIKANKTNKNEESKEEYSNDNVARKRESCTAAMADVSDSLPFCKALQCCPCCGAALVAINYSDVMNRLNENIYSALSECTECGFVGAVRATSQPSQVHIDNTDNNNSYNECGDEVINGDDDVDDVACSNKKCRICSEKVNYLQGANSQEQQQVRTVAHSLPIYKPHASPCMNINKEHALQKSSIKVNDKHATTTTNEPRIETVSLCSPRFGRKTYITDEEYLFYRAQRLAAWEAEGCAERINPPASVTDDVYAPLPARTPRWRIKCNTYFGHDNADFVCI